MQPVSEIPQLGSRVPKMSPDPHSSLTPLGQTEPLCPYCGGDVGKVLGYRDCPRCGKYIHVKRRPLDRAYVMLTDTESLQCEEQWAIAKGRHDQWLQERMSYEAEATRLREQLGHEPTDHQIQVAMLEYDKQQCAAEGRWGHYSICIGRLAELARSVKDWQAVIMLQSQVGYLEAAGPTNHGKFDRKLALIAPGCACRMAEAAMAMGIRLEAVEPIFLTAAAQTQATTGANIQPSTAWRRVRAKIRKLYRRWADTGEADE